MKTGGGWLPWHVAMPLVAAFGLLIEASALASVNLPLHHWAYEAIERLTALGIIDRAMVIHKPYSRKLAAKYVAQAIERIRSDQVPTDGQQAVAEPLLERLMRELEPELVDLGVKVSTQARQQGAIRYGVRTQLEADAFSVGRGSVRFRENRGGEYYANGEQVQTDIRGWVELTDALALTVQPKFISNQHVLGIGANDNSKNFYMREFNAKFSSFNLALEVGRGTLWWGPGYHGSLLLTDHSFPLDMIKLGSDEPFRLPSFLEGLGEWKVNTFLAQLERDRDFPRANVFGLRISYLPTSRLELGFTRLTQFGGRGSGQSFPKTVFDTYVSPAHAPGVEVNEQVMVDGRLRIPQVPFLVPFPGGMQLYGELGGEDHWFEGGQFRVYPLAPAFLVGIYVPQVFKDGTMELRVEYADTVFAAYHSGTGTHPGLWYNNATYVSGMRHRGFPLGHHMGTDAKDFFVRTTRYLTDDIQLGINFNRQRRNLLSYGGPSPEKKTEIALDLTWWLTSRTQLTIGHTYQRIENPGQITSIDPFVETFESGVTSTNHFLWTNLSVEF
jgi:hypothetical protein